MIEVFSVYVKRPDDQPFRVACRLSIDAAIYAAQSIRRAHKRNGEVIEVWIEDNDGRKVSEKKIKKK